jgi:Protein of unknown function (DUF732)
MNAIPFRCRMSAARSLGSTCVTVLAAALLSAGICSADPGPRDPGYCGAREEPLDCVPYDGPTPPPPTPGEAAFVRNARTYAPSADDATLLRIGRGTCGMLRGGVTVNYIVPDIATHLRINNAAADQVLDAAMGYICTEIHIGANGADDSRPYH